MKLARPTNSEDRPKASCNCMDCHMAWPAGRKKKISVTAICGASSRYGRVLCRKTTRFSMDARPWGLRSEEHTSELQSLMRIAYAVFCRKQKQQINKSRHYTYTNT